jgi:transposase
MNELQNLTTQQTAVISHLLAGRTQREAASAVGVSEVTVSRWKRNDPNFIATLNQARKSLFDASNTVLLDIRRDAIQGIRDIIDDAENNTPWERLRAIEIILRYSQPPTGDTDPEQIQREFDSSRQLQAVIDRMGKRISSQLHRPRRDDQK